MTDSPKTVAEHIDFLNKRQIVQFCSEAESQPFTKKLIALAKLVMKRMANKPLEKFMRISINGGPSHEVPIEPFKTTYSTTNMFINFSNPTNKDKIKDLHNFIIGEKVELVDNQVEFERLQSITGISTDLMKSNVGKQMFVASLSFNGTDAWVRLIEDEDLNNIAGQLDIFITPACIKKLDSNKCTCDTMVLMTSGCKCGGK